MANIKINVTGKPYTGRRVTFTAPCNCDQVTDGIVINGDTYTVCDAMGECVTGIGGVWIAGAQISVVLDCENKKAFIQNGATPPASGATPIDIILAANAWVNGTQTITNEEFVASEYNYIVSPTVESAEAYHNARICADDIAADGAITFRCEHTPTVAITVKILKFGAVTSRGTTGGGGTSNGTSSGGAVINSLAADKVFFSDGDTFQQKYDAGELTGPAGITPHVGDNDNWWIGDTDTGVKAKGEDGKDSVGGSGGSALDIYSTEETVIGTWIDGKPIYRIVIVVPSLPRPHMGDKIVDVPQLNIDEVVTLDGMFWATSTTAMSNNWNTTADYISLVYDSSGKYVYAWGSKAFESRPGFITLEYTKTTDTATNGISTTALMDAYEEGVNEA